MVDARNDCRVPGREMVAVLGGFKVICVAVQVVRVVGTKVAGVVSRVGDRAPALDPVAPFSVVEFGGSAQ